MAELPAVVAEEYRENGVEHGLCAARLVLGVYGGVGVMEAFRDSSPVEGAVAAGAIVLAGAAHALKQRISNN